LDAAVVFTSTPTFVWHPRASADSYRVVISGDENLSNTIVDGQGILASSYTLSGAENESLTFGNAYYWRVGVVDANRVDVVWSDTWSFTVQESPVTDVNETLEAQGLSLRMVAIAGTGEANAYREMMLTTYALSETEVTQGDYELVTGLTPAHLDEGVGATLPVNRVGWYPAVRFCNVLSGLCGLEPVYDESMWEADLTKSGFYLPTETQWEYAAGGPEHYTWSLGDVFDPDDYVVDDTQVGAVQTHPANGYGFYDMSGNVGEWCHDWSGSEFPHEGETDPIGPATGTMKVFRGGQFKDGSGQASCEYREHLQPDEDGAPWAGIRVALGGFGKW